MTFTAFELGRIFAAHTFDLAINAGIAGALDPQLKIGEVVVVSQEEFGEFGSRKTRPADSWTPSPWACSKRTMLRFQNGQLHNPSSPPFAESLSILKQVSGLTINKVHGCEASIARVKDRNHGPGRDHGRCRFLLCLPAISHSIFSSTFHFKLCRISE